MAEVEHDGNRLVTTQQYLTNKRIEYPVIISRDLGGTSVIIQR